MPKHIRKRDKRQLLMLVAAVAAVAIIIATAVTIVNNRRTKTNSVDTFLSLIHTYQDIDVPMGASPVVAAQRCLDVSGKTIAYTVTAFGEGFAERVYVKSFFDLDMKTLVCIDVMEHSETKGQGSKIDTEMFTTRFEFKKMPVWFYDGSVPEDKLEEQNGTRVDALSGATVSCNAVVEAVNAAYTYYTQTLSQ